MITVTSEYLINVIERHLHNWKSDSLSLHLSTAETNLVPSNVIADFLLSIPYFDAGLKNFILGKTTESVMIVSQAWEIEFIMRTKSWAASESWLSKTFSVHDTTMHNEGDSGYNFLKLPY